MGLERGSNKIKYQSGKPELGLWVFVRRLSCADMWAQSCLATGIRQNCRVVALHTAPSAAVH